MVDMYTSLCELTGHPKFRLHVYNSGFYAATMYIHVPREATTEVRRASLVYKDILTIPTKGVSAIGRFHVGSRSCTNAYGFSNAHEHQMMSRSVLGTPQVDTVCSTGGYDIILWYTHTDSRN